MTLNDQADLAVLAIFSSFIISKITRNMPGYPDSDDGVRAYCIDRRACCRKFQP